MMRIFDLITGYTRDYRSNVTFYDMTGEEDFNNLLERYYD